MRTVYNDELTMMYIRQKGFIKSIRSLDANIPGPTLNQNIAEMFPPARLLLAEIKDIPSVWIELWKHIDSHGSSLLQHSSRRVIRILVHSIYEEADDREAAVGIENSTAAEGSGIRTLKHGDSSRPPGIQL